jgi:hypothetical protein
MGSFTHHQNFATSAAHASIGDAQLSDAIYIGGNGDLEVVPIGQSESVTFKGLSGGTFLPIVISEIKAGTTASNIVRLGGSPSTITPKQNVITRVAWTGSANSNITHYDYIHTRLNSVNPLNIVYVLPVENLDNTTYGDGLTEVKQLMDAGDIADNFLFIQPRFATIPWYGNHPTDALLQQEDNTVELFGIINTAYASFELYESYVLGFSKSGYGAMNLALRHPNSLNGVLVWDSPLSVDTLAFAGMNTIFDNLSYFQANYILNDVLVTNNANLVGKTIVVGGYADHEVSSVEFTDDLAGYPSIDYTVDGTLTYAHEWNKLWVKALLDHIGI